MSAPTVFGINFGSSFASISIIGKEGHAECIANEEGERQIACAVSYNGEEIYMGNGAKPQLVKNSKNTITGFRNLLGKTFNEVPSTPSLSLTPSSQVIAVPDSDLPGYKVDILVPAPSATPKSVAGGKKSLKSTPAASGANTPLNVEPTPQELVLSVPEVTTLFLKSLLQSATDFLGTAPTDGCVIAAPASFDTKQRDALAQAARDAGINLLQIVDESAAVLVGYRAGLVEERKERGFNATEEEEKADKIVAVVDVGETGVEVEVVAVRAGEYVHLGGARDETIGGRELDKVLLSHFSKEFTKKTKVALPLPLTITDSTPEADLRAQTKLLLAVEHTKRSLSASSGAATCAVESLKDGMDLSGSINRMRFDGLAAGVYRKIGERIKAVVKDCGLDPVQIDEVLLAGSSSLLPGLAKSISYLFPESTPITTNLDPSQAISIGCALQALHLSQLAHSQTGLIDLSNLLHDPTTKLPTTAAPVGIVLPGGDVFYVVVPEATILPARRQVSLAVEAGATEVGVEVWEGKETIEVETIAAPPRDEDDSDDGEDDEPEEVSNVVLKATTYLTSIKVPVKATKAANVVLEIIVTEEGVEVKGWEEEAGEAKKPKVERKKVEKVVVKA
ncbi:Hsp70 protein-domain-containing protein [Mrakia frigida]|uniref:Hsp70 protein-domain-containing protein n=1 Tax=Mrakia frigida TaxID=29902 RepID=UPI003FCC0538